MRQKAFEKLKRAAALVDFLGVGLVILNMGQMIFRAFSLRRQAGESATDFGVRLGTSQLGLTLIVLIGGLGLVGLVLAILLLRQNRKFGEKNTAAILTLLAGIFSWLATYVALVLWLVAGVLLLKKNKP